MTPRTLYEIHQREVEEGREPYPFAFLLNGAPLFTWSGWLASVVKRLLRK